MTREEIMQDFDALEELLKKEDNMRSNFSGSWTGEQERELLRIERTCDGIRNKYGAILDELEIGHDDYEYNNLSDFIAFARELFKRSGLVNK